MTVVVNKEFLENAKPLKTVLPKALVGAGGLDTRLAASLLQGVDAEKAARQQNNQLRALNHLLAHEKSLKIAKTMHGQSVLYFDCVALREDAKKDILAALSAKNIAHKPAYLDGDDGARFIKSIVVRGGRDSDALLELYGRDVEAQVMRRQAEIARVRRGIAAAFDEIPAIDADLQAYHMARPHEFLRAALNKQLKALGHIDRDIFHEAARAVQNDMAMKGLDVFGGADGVSESYGVMLELLEAKRASMFQMRQSTKDARDRLRQDAPTRRDVADKPHRKGFLSQLKGALRSLFGLSAGRRDASVEAGVSQSTNGSMRFAARQGVYQQRSIREVTMS